LDGEGKGFHFKLGVFCLGFLAKTLIHRQIRIFYLVRAILPNLPIILPKGIIFAFVYANLAFSDTAYFLLLLFCPVFGGNASTFSFGNSGLFFWQNCWRQFYLFPM
jgi:hypothetical protein